MGNADVVAHWLVALNQSARAVATPMTTKRSFVNSGVSHRRCCKRVSNRVGGDGARL